jgi:hypothetical protein
LLILPFLPYVLFAIGVILGWRFNNGGLILSFVILGLAYFSLSDAAYRSQGRPMSEAVRILLPWNLGLFTTLTRRRLLTPVGLSCVGVVVLQIYLFLLLFQTIDFPLSRLIPEGTMFYRFLAEYSARVEGWL